MVENISVIDQVHELQVLMFKLKDLKVVVLEVLQVGGIIAKLPPNWNDHKKSYCIQQKIFLLNKFRKT